MTSALNTKQSLMLPKSDIKFNATKSKYFVETEMSLKLAYFVTSGGAPQGPTSVLIQGHVSLQTLSHLKAAWLLGEILTLLYTG